MLSEVEAKLVREKSLGYLVTIEEKPVEKYDFFTVLSGAALISLFTGTFLGFPASAILAGIFSALQMWFPKIYPIVSPLVVIVSSPHIAIAFFGLLGALGVSCWNYYYSKQPYSSRVVILSNGFIYCDILEQKRGRFACRYSEIVSVNVYLASYSGLANSGCNIYYRYYVSDQENYIISSPSLVLMRHVVSYIYLTRWADIRDLLERGEEVCFGDICVRKQYIRIKQLASSYNIKVIKEIVLQLSSEDDSFYIEFIPGFRPKLARGVFVCCEKVSNFYLFSRALQFVGVTLNLSQLPILEEHLKLVD
jgi:hypothetical protein